ncbi:MAG: stage II sporulation protein SpoIID, partial [Halanaerobium sp.]
MKKVFRLIMISALLLGLLFPVVSYVYQNEEIPGIIMAQEGREANIKELLKLAKAAYYEGNYQSAENYYQEIIERAPFNLESRRNLAVIYNDQNKLNAENKMLLQLTILSNQSEDYLKLAVNFYKMNNSLASNYILENKIEEGLNRKDLLFQKYYYLIKNHLNLKNYEQAEENLMKITNLKINQSEIYLL